MQAGGVAGRREAVGQDRIAEDGAVCERKRGTTVYTTDHVRAEVSRDRAVDDGRRGRGSARDRQAADIAVEVIVGHGAEVVAGNVAGNGAGEDVYVAACEAAAAECDTAGINRSHQ